MQVVGWCLRLVFFLGENVGTNDAEGKQTEYDNQVGLCRDVERGENTHKHFYADKGEDGDNGLFQMAQEATGCDQKEV